MRSAQQWAEYDRLARALRNGPDRRITADKRLGRAPDMADVWQAASYRRQMDALRKGRA